MQIIRFHATKPVHKTKICSKIIASLNYPDVIPGKSVTKWTDVTIPIPSSVTISSNDQSRLIQINYKINIKYHVSSSIKIYQISLPIVIGTIPIRQIN